MNKLIALFASLAFAGAVFAADYTPRSVESTGEALSGATVTAGTLTVTTNATVAGTLGVTGIATFTANVVANGDIVGDNSTVVTNMAEVESATYTVGGTPAAAGATLTFYSVAAGTAAAITNVITHDGILTAVTQTP